MLAAKMTTPATMATCSSSSSSSSSRLIAPPRNARAASARTTTTTTSRSMAPKRTLATSSFASPSPRQQRSPVVALASSTASSSSSSLASTASAEVQDAISTLKRAARRAWAVPASETLAAILVLEKAKLIPESGDSSSSSWLEAVAGGPQGRRWRLMFTSGTDQVRKAAGGGRSGGGGVYIPITAVQRWRLSDRLIENGVYLGFLGAFVFSGRWESKGRRLSFDFDSVRLRVGPWSRDFAVKGKKAEEEAKSGKKSLGPFFLFAYADDDICVARGRSGGVALWARASGDWQVKAGIDA